MRAPISLGATPETEGEHRGGVGCGQEGRQPKGNPNHNSSDPLLKKHQVTYVCPCHRKTEWLERQAIVDPVTRFVAS